MKFQLGNLRESNKMISYDKKETIYEYIKIWNCVSSVAMQLLVESIR